MLTANAYRNPTGSSPVSKIEQALQYLVTHVYSELDLITKNAETDADIFDILTGNESADGRHGG
jgi:hypothetical protein